MNKTVDKDEILLDKVVWCPECKALARPVEFARPKAVEYTSSSKAITKPVTFFVTHRCFNCSHTGQIAKHNGRSELINFNDFK